MVRIRNVKKPTVIQWIFYSFVFLTGVVYQPNWVWDNFWAKAEFYEDIPFTVPYLAYALVYSTLNCVFWYYCVRLAKKYL